MKPTINPTAIILRFIHRHFIWMIVSSYVIGAMTPGFGLWIRNANIGGAGYSSKQASFSPASFNVGGAIIQCRSRGENGRTDSPAPKTIRIAWRTVMQFNDSVGLHR